MGYEIINRAQVTPMRLHALLRLIPRIDHPTRKALEQFCQPPELGINNADAFDEVYSAARRCGLIKEDEHGTVSVAFEPREAEKVDDFRSLMQGKLLRVLDDQADNYLLNVFTAWYAVHDEAILTTSNQDLAIQFNTELFPEAEPRPFNPTKKNAWDDWARFLGFAWCYRHNAPLIPDASGRLEPLLPVLLPEKTEIAFRVFATRMADHCPELDGGVLFERCWQAARGTKIRGNALSLMVSTALRSLHQRGKIHLIRIADATDTWSLFPDTLFHPNTVSHIRRNPEAA